MHRCHRVDIPMLKDTGGLTKELLHELLAPYSVVAIVL